ncbi:hypothetical protein [Viscerimonas tarda]
MKKQLYFLLLAICLTSLACKEDEMVIPEPPENVSLLGTWVEELPYTGFRDTIVFEEDGVVGKYFYIYDEAYNEERDIKNAVSYIESGDTLFLTNKYYEATDTCKFTIADGRLTIQTLKDADLFYYAGVARKEVSFVRVCADCAGEPKNIDIQDFAIPVICWSNNIEDKKLYLINSQQDWNTHFSCNIPNAGIDFEKYTLVVARGHYPSIVYRARKQLTQIEPNKYQMNIEAFITGLASPGSWRIAVLTSKISQDAVVELNLQHP